MNKSPMWLSKQHLFEPKYFRQFMTPGFQPSFSLWTTSLYLCYTFYHLWLYYRYVSIVCVVTFCPTKFNEGTQMESVSISSIIPETTACYLWMWPLLVYAIAANEYGMKWLLKSCYNLPGCKPYWRLNWHFTRSVMTSKRVSDVIYFIIFSLKLR